MRNKSNCDVSLQIPSSIKRDKAIYDAWITEILTRGSLLSWISS